MGILNYRRMPIEIEAPEQFGYENIQFNLAESSVFDFNFSDFDFDLKNLKLAYCDHLGKIELRKLLIEDCKNLSQQHVLLTNGAAGALFIVATSMLNKTDHLIVVSPNYANNIETPQLIGCEITKLHLTFQQQFSLYIEDIKTQLKPNTKLISLTTPHNPTGVILSLAQIKELEILATEHNLYILFDETYKGLTKHDNLPYLADLSDRFISVSSLSKSFGLPGIRMGWVMTQDEHLNDLFLAAKEQIHLTNSILDEEVAYQFLKNKNVFLNKIKVHVEQNFEIVKNWITLHANIEWIEPKGGVVCFPRIKDPIDIKMFYKTLNDDYKTWVGPGRWFDLPDTYFRIGYGWPSREELMGGLENIDKALGMALK